MDDGSYFVINKGRQYGKTTTLRALEGFLKDDYTVLSLDFQQLSTANFDIEMNFSVGQIATMLQEYEIDRHTGIDEQAVAEEIYAYTSRYPVLVSMICQRIDEKITGCDGFEDLTIAWSRIGVEKAVKMILADRAPLFESMTKQLDFYPDLYKIVEDIIYCGKKPFIARCMNVAEG